LTTRVDGEVQHQAPYQGRICRAFLVIHRLEISEVFFYHLLDGCRGASGIDSPRTGDLHPECYSRFYSALIYHLL
jgi:hypothetical protein